MFRRWNRKTNAPAGVVIDGATRDAVQLRRLSFPTFVRRVTPRNFDYPFTPEYGAVNVEVSCGGVIVHPGDVIIGDDDGVVAVPKTQAEQMAETIVSEMLAQEREREIKAYKPYDVRDELRARGYTFE
jgi:4-hydroxy-4-methyl-2-oxoglutarate aldolase